MSKQFRLEAAYMHAENKKHSAVMKPMDVAVERMPQGCIAVWRSNRFLAQIYAPKDGGQRISICRTMIDTGTGKWIDGLVWDEIQQIKRDLGFGDRMAVEIYPADSDIVNVANMRHIWLVDPLAFAWRSP